MPYWMFLTLRFLKTLLVIVTAPLWVPGAAVLIMVLYSCESISDGFAKTRHDWEKRYGKK